jgi:hypothetical protein
MDAKAPWVLRVLRVALASREWQVQEKASR